MELALTRRPGLEPLVEGTLRNNLAMTYLQLNDHRQAVAMASEAVKLHEQVGDLRGLACAHSTLADCYSGQGDLADAIHHLTAAAELNRQLENANWLTSNLLALGKLLSKAGRATEARTAWLDALCTVDARTDRTAGRTAQREEVLRLLSTVNGRLHAQLG